MCGAWYIDTGTGQGEPLPPDVEATLHCLGVQLYRWLHLNDGDADMGGKWGAPSAPSRPVDT